jgi:hypothetical protein
LLALRLVRLAAVALSLASYGYAAQSLPDAQHY